MFIVSTGEAMEKMIQEKKFSSKINYDILKNLTDSKPSDIMNRRNSISSTYIRGGASASLTAGALSLPISAESSDSAAVGGYLPGIVNETPDTNSSVR